MVETKEIKEDFENLYIEVHKKEAEIQYTIKKEQLGKLKKISEVKKQYESDLQELEDSLAGNKKKREDLVLQNLQKYLLEIDKEYNRYFSQLERVALDKKDEINELITNQLLKV